MTDKEPYSKREVDNLHTEIMGYLERIEKQTTKTNGRITKLELWKAQLEGGKLVLKGLWTIGGVFVIAGIFSLFQMYNAIQDLPVAISLEVRDQLETINIEIIE